MNMFFPFPLAHPSGLLLAGFNALLRREPWALDQLAAHSGKSLRLSAGGSWCLNTTVTSDGSLQACDAAVIPDVVLSIPSDRLSQLPTAWRRQGMAGVTGLVHIQGDAGLAHLVSDLARSLRWDVEDDLSRVVGDVMAVRLAQGAGRLADSLRLTARRAGDNLSEYLSEESGLGLRQAELRLLASQLQGLDHRLSQLEVRLYPLDRALS